MNAETKEVETTQVVEESLSGPGERLRAARIALGIDIKKVAGQLRLTSDVVEALERDDYSEMTARVFVRGYIRNYARLVELPVDSIIEQFDRLWPDDARPVKFSKPPKLPSDSRLSKRSSGFLNWFLVLLVGVLFLVWWQGYLDEFMDEQLSLFEQTTETTGQEPSEVQEVQPGQAMQLPQLSQPQPEPQVIGQQQQAVPLPASAETQQQQATATPPAPEPTEVATEQASGNSENTEAEAASEDAVQASEATADETTENTAETNTGQVTETAEAAPVEPTPQAAQNEIYISFADVCWVDIRDKDRAYKLLGQMKKGDKHKLEGVPPYNIVIGNASAASITVDGEAFDIKPYSKGNVARFTLTP